MRSFLKSDEARKLLAGKPFAVFVVCRRYWRENLAAVRKLGEKQGGRYVDGVHFAYPGDQLRSMLSLTSYRGITKLDDLTTPIAAYSHCATSRLAISKLR